jgi:hypothetical protein
MRFNNLEFASPFSSLPTTPRPLTNAGPKFESDAKDGAEADRPKTRASIAGQVKLGNGKLMFRFPPGEHSVGGSSNGLDSSYEETNAVEIESAPPPYDNVKSNTSVTSEIANIMEESAEEESDLEGVLPRDDIRKWSRNQGNKRKRLSPKQQDQETLKPKKAM